MRMIPENAVGVASDYHIDSRHGAGKRLQPKTRWGINVCYGKGIVPILTNGTAAPAADLTITAPGSKASG